MRDRPHISWGWDEGRFFDRWMFVHLLCGLACGFANVLVAWPPMGALVATGAAMTAWELGEAVFGVEEAWENRVIDVIVGLAGALLALAVLPRVSPAAGRRLFWSMLTVFAIGDVLGWRAYRRRRTAPAEIRTPSSE